MAKMNHEEALGVVKELLGTRDAMKSAPGMRDRLIEVAGDRAKIVKLMDAVGSLPRELTEDR